MHKLFVPLGGGGYCKGLKQGLEGIKWWDVDAEIKLVYVHCGVHMSNISVVECVTLNPDTQETFRNSLRH